MFKVKVYDYMELVYLEYYETLQAAKEDFQSQLEYIDSEKCYDWDLREVAFTVQVCSMEGGTEKILESVQA